MSALFNPETVWVLIPLAAIIGTFILKAQRLKMQSLRGADDQARFAELGESLKRLEQRVGNLERAVMTAEAERKYAL